MIALILLWGIATGGGTAVWAESFSPEAVCSTWIDSVWFTEETVCDSQNVVEVCYILSSTCTTGICPESLFSVVVSASFDSGATWEFPFDSVWDTTGDFGEVRTGVHCFYWDFGVDSPDYESRSFMVGVSTMNAILDTFVVVDSIDISARPDYGRGLGYGDGYYWVYDYDRNWIYKTPCLWYCSPVDSIYVGATNCDISYSNGYVYIAVDDGRPDVLLRYDVATGMPETVFVGDTSWNIQGVQAACGNIFFGGDMPVMSGYLMLRCDDTTHISSIDTITHQPYDTCSMTEGLAYALGYIWGCNNFGRIIQIDPSTGNIEGCHPVPNVGYGAEGLCWDGQYLWYHNNGTRKLYKILIYDSTLSRTVATAPVDSRSPRITINCPSVDLFYPGDTVLLSWRIDDLFRNTDSSQLEIRSTSCGFDTVIMLTDSYFVWVVPDSLAGCDSIFFYLGAKDSFCNIATAMCGPIRVCAPSSAELLCPIEDAVSSCTNQVVEYLITDDVGIDTSGVFISALVFHPDSSVDSLSAGEIMSHLGFACVGDSCESLFVIVEGLSLADGDSVWVSLDSVINRWGCITRFGE
ncbi:hypothetical protein J7K99_02110 [bacterium]|nr:hypothetical protein [bacterium]